MRKSLFALLSALLIASFVLAACGGAAPAAQPAAPAAEATQAPAAAEATKAPEAAAAVTSTEATTTTEAATSTEATTTTAEAAAAPAATQVMTPTPTVEIMPGRTQVRWYVGLGSGTDPQQQKIQQEVVDEFNKSQDKIQLILEVVPYASARDTLATQIAAGNGPDIVGPVGVGGSNAFYGQWKDLSPEIKKANYDLTQYNEQLVKFYQTEEGQVGIPFAVYPSMVFFQKKMFDEAGLSYPPAKYGEKYKMPDGTEVDWNWDTLTKIAKILTVDANGNDASMPEFDKTKVVQYGYVPQYQDPPHIGAFWGAGSMVAEDGKTAQVPQQWQDAWKWYYDGMWGKEPFIPNDTWVAAPEGGNTNAFNSGKVAMGITHMWYTCCIKDAGQDWDLAVLPSRDGKVNGRIDADTFRVWKGTKNPDATFEVLQYLVGPASLKLLQTYGGMPSRTADLEQYFKDKATQFPWVKNWDVVQAGMNYPDIPSAEGYVPNWNEVWDRVRTLRGVLGTTPNLNVDEEIAKFTKDLQTIYDKAATKQ